MNKSDDKAVMLHVKTEGTACVQYCALFESSIHTLPINLSSLNYSAYDNAKVPAIFG